MRAHRLQHVAFEGLSSIAPWLADEKEFVGEVLRAGVPMLRND